MSDGMVAVPQAFCCDVAFHPPLAPCTIFYRTQHWRAEWKDHQGL